jgi:hypothetical protein
MTRIMTRRGRLADFIRRPGDPEYTPDSRSARWGAIRRLTSTITAPTNQSRATLIATGDLGRSEEISIRLRFARSTADGQPAAAFSPNFDDASGNCVVQIRRGIDIDAAPATDTFTIFGPGTSSGAPSTDGNRIQPFDVVSTRSLGVDIEIVNATDQWFVEAIATVVTQPAVRDRIIGWPVLRLGGTAGFFAASNVLQQFLFQRADRSQFFIQNTSTNSALYIGFQAGVSTLPANASIILPGNIFAIYEAPPGGWRGDVFGIWDVLAPNGGALVTEGTFY